MAAESGWGEISPHAETEAASFVERFSRGQDAGELPVKVGRYEIRGYLGQGGMGIVFEAHDPQLDRRVAVKLLRYSDGVSSEAQKRLLREAQAMAKLSHPNVVSVYDAGMFDLHVFVAMELVSGQTLRGWSKTPHSWREVLDLFIQAGRGLAAAHDAGMIHRDFKPDNVMVRDDGRALVMDFGLARGSNSTPRDLQALNSAAPSTLSRTGILLGTPRYMSPEQLATTKVDVRSDQFSYCVSFFEILFGRHPFPASTPMEQLVAIAGCVPVVPASARRAPSWLRQALLRGLRREPLERWPSMTALLDHIERRSRFRAGWPAAAIGSAVVATGSLWYAGTGVPRLSVELAPSAENLPAAPKAGPAPTSSRLVIDARPLDSVIMIDGRVMGTTSVDVSVDEGKHFVRVSHEGYVTVEREIISVPGVRDDIFFALERQVLTEGNVAPTSNPTVVAESGSTQPDKKKPKAQPKNAELKIGSAPGMHPATVWVDGQKLSRATPVSTMVTAGTHTVKWKYPDGKIVTKRVEALRDHATVIKGEP